MSITCLIADDEVIAHQILEQYILKTEGLTLVAKCRNAIEAMAKMEQYQVDLLFLDIEMPLVNGISFLRALTAPPKVIFTTAYAEYALQGYELNVTDYLLKPFSYDRFVQAVNKVKQQLAVPERKAPEEGTGKDHLVVKEKEGLLKIAFADIIYIEGSRDYMKIVTSARQYLVHLTMKKLEELLPAHRFIRTHKSYIVSVPHIKIVKPAELLLNNQQVIPVSVNYKEQVLKSFGG
ncbi:two component transcriptional regulator, LytTR family [Filimonas lacunae]|uniref:Two component transcriptional regulator, LytTR family n=1 Tax=Filimonas lacunae TaxID=477680 RepID=A0A173M9L1_9BACT|nr:LytTR family DNA-binding domain-containing protein [Filimonas lacunae]BAV04234.1 two-component system response regulator [Filimonas lacunae]SIT13805.1 two component transcriptional regulator, LytTR family [Filimonas lacunae]